MSIGSARSDQAGRGGAETITPFERLAGTAAVVAAVLAVVYAITFVLISATSDLKAPLTAFALTAGGLLSSLALVAVYERVRSMEPSFALLGLLVGFAGTLGAALHGGYDLANVFHPPSIASGPFPSQVDPRGMLTFLASGLGVLSLTWASHRAVAYPPRLVMLGYLLGVLLVIIYLGRLIVFDPDSVLLLIPAGLAGVIVSPLWYGWIGYLLLTGRAGPMAPAAR
jgi:hypothetical protein